MTSQELKTLFSQKRLDGYSDEAEHKNNFLLMQKIAPRLGIIEIIARNKVSNVLNITDDKFISAQTLGFWVTIIEKMRIQNKVIKFKEVDFLKYSKFNKKHNWLDFEITTISYSLIRTIRNRAFHFENLYKINTNNTPRLSTKLHGQIIGIEPSKIDLFLDDILKSFNDNLTHYVDGD